MKEAMIVSFRGGGLCLQVLAVLRRATGNQSWLLVDRQG